MSSEASSVNFPPTKTVTQLVEEAARRNPTQIAVRFGGVGMSYAALDAGANRWAANLHGIGVGREEPVGIVVERSFEQITAILAVLKSGAAFLPLDPAWPKDRLRSLLDDSGARVVIGKSGSADDLAADDRIAVDLEHDAARLATPDPDRAAAPPALGDLAYIIYTSGSLGGPKGVEISHANLSNLIAWHRNAFAVTAADRASHIAGLGFDAAVWEVWPYLAVGATVSLPPEAARRSPGLLRDWLIAERITIGFAPTALAEHLIAADWPAEVPLRLLLTGAETLHRFPRPDLPFALVNNYGPTECTVVATSGIVPNVSSTGPLPTIGRPISNTQIYLLDESGSRVGDGEVGEIYIGGAAVARGYRGRPALTAERFLPDGFASQPGGSVYRTGDLGRRLPDGSIAFHGRVDDQIKLRGYRVEPDEIAGALDRHPSVAASVVAAVGHTRDEQRLIAYFVPGPGAAPSAGELRQFLAAQLPDYMVPSAFVPLAALPLTSSGKVDRAALPDPGVDSATEAYIFPPEASPTERRLAQIIAEVSGRIEVSKDDNFFLIGGHSLSGTQVVLRAREAFGVELTLRHLFEAHNVGDLAAVIERLARERLETVSDEEADRILAGQP